MRIKNDYVKTTRREDHAGIYAFAEAMNKMADFGINGYKQLHLGAFKNYIIDQNRELMKSHFEAFLSILDELNVKQPKYKTSKRHISFGSWYVIPAEGSKHKGKTKTERLEMRRQNRIRSWNSAMARFGLENFEVSQHLKLHMDEYEVLKADISELRDEVANLSPTQPGMLADHVIPSFELGSDHFAVELNDFNISYV